MLDSALYLLDYPDISYVCATSSDRIGKTSKVGLMGGWDPERFTVEDGIFGYIRFADGTSLDLQTSFAINRKERDVRSVKSVSYTHLKLFPESREESTEKSWIIRH